MGGTADCLRVRRRSTYISGNRISQTRYDTDGRGNLKQAPTLAGPLEKMVYDGEERQAVYCYGIAAGTACDGSYANKTVYHYDAEGRRVRREGVGSELGGGRRGGHGVIWATGG